MLRFEATEATEATEAKEVTGATRATPGSKEVMLAKLYSVGLRDDGMVTSMGSVARLKLD